VPHLGAFCGLWLTLWTKRTVSVVYLGFRKAFGMIPYRTLTAKLVRSGVDSKPKGSQQCALAEKARCALH